MCSSDLTGAYAGSSYVNPNGDLTPETSINYDVGVRAQRDGLTLDATAFYTESEDYIDHLPCTVEDLCPGARDRIYINIGESRAYGVEVAVSHSGLIAVIEPYASVTWVKRRNEFDAFSTWDSGIPELSGRLGLRWQGEVHWVRAAWGDFYLRGETGSDLKEPGSARAVLEEQSGWVTLNAALGFQFGSPEQYRLSAELANLTDKKYVA